MKQNIIDITTKNLKNKGYDISFFSEPSDAIAYLEEKISGKTVGFGDSLTIKDLGLNETLSKKNKVWDPSLTKDNDEFLRIAKATLLTDIYLTSVNAISQTGELVNIDGTGNRVAGSLFGHEKVYFVVSTNKIVPDLQQAIHRAQNIAAPKNNQKFNSKTPCAVKGDCCYDCKSPDRICSVLAIHMQKMNDIEMEVILIDQEFGY